MAGQTASLAERLAVEQAYLGPLPAHAPDVGLVGEGVVGSTGQVRFEANVSSVPIQYAYRRLVLKADPFDVRLYADDTLVATHPGFYAQGDVRETSGRTGATTYGCCWRSRSRSPSPRRCATPCRQVSCPAC